MTCPVCRSDDSRLLFEKSERHFNLCFNCQAAYQVERHSSSGQFYASSYYSDNQRSEGQFINWVQQNEIIKKLKSIKRIIPVGRLLDIGCGYGYFLHYAGQQGYQVEGIEPNEYSVKKARALFGLEPHLGYFGQITPAPFFDIITAFHVIEHTIDPRSFLRQISDLLRVGGIAIIETPNYHSVNSRRLGADWPFIIPDEHLTYFSLKSIGLLLDSCGFSIISQKHTGPFLYKKSHTLKNASTSVRVSPLFKLMKYIYYFFSESLGLGDHLFIIAQKNGRS